VFLSGLLSNVLALSKARLASDGAVLINYLPLTADLGPLAFYIPFGILKWRLLCPYLVEQPYLAASQHSLGNTASDA
jgi:hypothetical protein